MDLRDIKEFLKDALKYIIAIAVILIFAIYVVSFQEVIGPSIIIGLPGEHIEYKDNILYVDGKKISDSRSSSTKDFKLESIGYDTIPKDMYLVLGDNRTNSSDSRTFGLVKKSDIIGKVNIRIYPFNKIKIF